MSLNPKLKNNIVYICLGFFMLVLIVNKNFIEILKNRNKSSEILLGIKQTENEILKLNEEILKLETDMEYIEYIAREKFIMHKENEEIYKFKCENEK